MRTWCVTRAKEQGTWLGVEQAQGYWHILPVRIMTPIAGSSRASDMQRMISSMVSGRKAFLLSGLLIVICMSNPEP